MSCTIFKRSFFSDISNLDNLNIDISWLKNKIPPYNPKLSGIWMPISINLAQSNIDYVDILSRAKSEQNFFDPCNCDPSSKETDDEDETQELSCNYCSSDIQNYYSTSTWTLTDTLNNRSKEFSSVSCCDGGCDVRITKDDYLTKLPVLNCSYLTKFYDWKYKKQFPACSNKGLGKEKFIRGNQFESFTVTNAELIIDWKIKERISEIPPNDIDSYHDTIDHHEKSYKRSLISSKTCGNFILTKLGKEYTNNPTYPLFSGLIGDISITGNYSSLLPKPDTFTKPYGFKNQDYHNIFIKTEKVGSYWKWNYTSGILCWYRYFNIGNNDDRLIKDVDLYISDGDVFYAKNDGPENSSVSYTTSDSFIHNCPSGLKLIKNNTVTGILPNDSEFIYISENLYPKFYNILNRIEGLEVELDIPSTSKIKPIKKLELAAMLATGPDYDEVTIDLFKTISDLDDPAQDYDRDIFKRISVFNSGMLHKSQYKLNQLNIVKTKTDLVNTLANKYGSYIWFPPNVKSTIEFNKTITPHSYIDLDFEPVVKESDTYFYRECGDIPLECADTVVSKVFAYDQDIKISNFNLNTIVDKKYKSISCTSGVFKTDKSANTISAYFNNSLIKEAYYGSGCTRFYQKYPRVPSYDIALKQLGPVALCKDSLLCDENLAKVYDHQPPGIFEDKSIILDRRYPANYCNTNIDRIGFNKQGGVYYDSNIFGSGNIVFKSNSSPSNGKCSISFSNKDIGIKLYNLEIYKLRDENNSQCKTFPLDRPCKCFPLSYVEGFRYNCDGSLTFSNAGNVLYTPNLSTQVSPRIKSYGGYTIEEVDSILGSGNRLDNHPEVNTSLSTVNRIIDPLNPYECEESITVNFPNYIYTKWNSILPKQYNTSHADVWVKIIEPVDLFNQFINFEDEDGEIISKINQNYRRYTTKIEINDKVLYGNQQDILFSKDVSVPLVTMELTSPFLYALLSEMSNDIDKNKLLYTPLPCSLDINRNYENAFDPYLVKNISIVFKRLPRKQMLAYKFKPLTKIGNLQKVFFHPNSGLISDSDFSNKTSLSFNSGLCSFDFDYERKIFNQNNGDYSDSGIIYSGTITKDVQRILESVDNLLNHKKLRLYIKYNNNWYEYTNPHVFGFYNKSNNYIYPGYPLFFEYAKNEKYKTELLTNKYVNPELNNSQILTTKPSAFIPASAKQNTEFSYIYNSINSGLLTSLPNNHYPVFNEIFLIDKDSNNKILVPGTRSYFLIEEDDPAIKIDKITNISEDTQRDIFKNTFLIDKSKQRWRYKGTGSKIDEKSYELILSRNYRDNNFSEGFIAYNNSNKKGYIANTSLPTKLIDIELIDIKNPKNVFKTKIKSKSIRAPKSDKYGNDIPLFNAIKPNEYLRTYTVLELDICNECNIPISEGYIKIVNPTLPDSPESFILYQDFSSILKLEKDYLLSNNQMKTKWGDLIQYDNNNFQDLSNSKFLHQTIERYYPKTLYDNLLYSISLNNLETGVFKAMLVSNGTGSNSSKSGVLSYSGSIYYNIHQIYNIGLNKYLENIITDYQNYLPFIDINFLNTQQIKSKPWFENIKNNYKYNIPSIGKIYISGIRSYTDTSLLTNNPESGAAFFISIDKNQYLQPVLFDKEFYYDSLRVDDIYYKLGSLSKEENFDSNKCRSVFLPNISFKNKILPDYFNINAFSSTTIAEHYYENLPIYCDIDIPGKCTSESCGLKVNGWTRLKAAYSHYEYSFIKANVLEESSGDIEYALSVDEGLYNIIGNDSIPYIQRFEIEPKSNLFPNTTLDGSTNCVKGNDPRPNRPQNFIDYEYQNKLKDFKLQESNKGDLVKNTDILANEMLFRLIYGTRQPINYKTIKKLTVEESIQYQKESSLSYLLQYSHPKTTADLIYKLIPYDYANQSDQTKRKVSGSISIDGVLSIGKTVSIKIGNSTISINIQKQGGKIYSIAQCNGITVKNILHDEDGIVSGMFAITGDSIPSPPDTNTTYRLLATCDIPDTYSWSKGFYFSAMKYNNGEKEIDVVAEYKKCISRVAEEGQCVNKINWGYGNYPDSSVLNSGFVDCVGTPPCVGCVSRGYSDGVVVPDNCTIISQRRGDVNIGGYSRGLFGVNNVFADCAPRQNASISTSPCQYDGDFDAFVGGLVMMQYFGRNNCSTAPSSCKGTCISLDYSDKWGDVNKPSRFSTTGDSYSICECTTYQYGYCAIPDTNCSCHGYYPGFPKIFSYDFEYCNYNFNMRGHLWKLADGDPPVWRNRNQDIPCTTEEYEAGPSTASATEICYWLECKTNAQDINIWESITRNPNPYRPLCPTNLCNINYDNNTITLTLTGLNSVIQCFPNPIRVNCPEITITLPDNTFTFNDSINSECTECSVEKNAIVGPLSQNPDWDIITETRTAIIGWTLPIEGDKNIDVMGGGGAVYVDKSICGDTQPCCCDNCYSGAGAVKQCGKSAPNSWPWLHGLTCNLNGSPDPSFTQCKRRTSSSLINNLRGGIGFYVGSDNGAVKTRVIADWKNQMRSIYQTQAPCFNKQDNTIDVNDLVEGVIPGSCSDLKFAIASYPIVAWRNTLSGGEMTQGSYGVHYAYFTYEYKRPRTIQDVFLGDNASKCATVLPILPTRGYNISEKYVIQNCQTTPTCDDIKPSECDDNNYCCKNGR